MKIKVMLVLSLLIVLVLGACQPTPSKPAVVNKGNGNLEKIIASTAVSPQTLVSNNGSSQNNGGEITQTWKETYTLPGLTCDIDADVVLPAANEFPVYKVKQLKFDTETLGKIVKYFTKDATGVRDTSDTKEELEEQLILAKKGLYVEDDNGGKWEHYDGQQQDIANLEKQIDNSQPEVFGPITDSTISVKMNKTYAMPNDKRIYVNADSGGISIIRAKYGILQPESWIVNGDAYPGEPSGTKIDNIKISEEEAQDRADAFVSEIGIKNYGIAETEKARILENCSYEILSKGWLVTFARNDGNSIPVHINPSQTGGILYSKPEDYVYRWPYEYFNVYIDENGIQSFDWENPIEVVETMNSNVPIKSFDEIKQKIRDYIKYTQTNYSQYYIKKYGSLNEQKVKLSKVVLTNVPVPIKDVSDYQMLVPAWIVYLKQDNSLGTLTSLLAINAIDGSNIDLVYKPNS